MSFVKKKNFQKKSFVSIFILEVEFSKKKKKSFIKKKNPRRNVLQRKFFQEKEFLRKIFCKYFSKKGIFKKKK